VVDTTNTWWVSPSFDGFELIRWCSVIEDERTYYLNLYDFNADPAYDFWEMDILDYFQNPGRGELPEPVQCPG
jgi:hypothetical protein